MSFRFVRLSGTPVATRGRNAVACLGVLLGLVATSFSGCSRSNADAEEEHAHHTRPAHRPHDLQEAVADLRARWMALPTLEHEAREVRRTELADLLRWLPEIAGESELGESDWNKVAAIAGELVAIFESQPPENPLSGKDAARQTELLNTLDDLARQAGPSIYGRRHTAEPNPSPSPPGDPAPMPTAPAPDP